MRSQLLTIITKCWLILGVVLLLPGCGGGGGSGDESVGTAASGSFTLSQTTLAISGYQHLLSTTRHDINMTITGEGVTYAGAAYANGQTPVNWLQFDMSGSGKNYTLSVIVNPGLMATGQSTAAFTVGTSDAKGNVLSSKVVTVSADLWRGMQATITEKNELKRYGAVEDTLTFPVAFTADNRTNWQVSSNQTWLTLSQVSGQGDASFSASVDTTKLVAGNHQAEITVQDSQVSNHKLTFVYRLTLDTPMFDFTGEDGVLGGENGMEHNTISISFSPGTEQYSHPYRLSFETDNGIAWLTADESEGRVSGTGKTLQIRSIAPANMEGTFTGRAVLRVQVGQLEFTRTINIKLHKEHNRISLGSGAVALSSAPDKSLLSRDIPVLHSLDRTDLTWQARSDANWLSVTPSGAMGQSVTLQANPAGLAPDQTYYATVTVSADNPLSTNSEHIKVGFTILSTVPEQKVLTLPRTDSSYEDKIFRAVSPVQPVIVIGYGSNLAAYNIYTAEMLLDMTNSVAGVGGITYSFDGSKVFVFDNVDNEFVTLDAANGSTMATYPLGNIFSETLSLLHVKQNGKQMLYGMPGTVFDTETGAKIAIAENSQVPASKSLNAGYAPQQIISAEGELFTAYYSALNGGQISSQYQYQLNPGQPGQACFDPYGRYIYMSFGAQYNFAGYNLQSANVDKILPGQAYPNAVVCSADGLIIGGTNALYDQNDIFVYAADGRDLGMLNSAITPNSQRRLVTRGLSVSNDGSQLIAVTERVGNTEIKFMRLPTAN